ncbi:hypothetical protein AVEN_84935-1 [Araneus ventricosus]|uniref:Uncharacterized protein n=1 Tax=Araneus ventricosus TaxID=182803 RepID=A0A4Y2BZJ1_ARAVE|nr:hypothetical protein AVEN_84935-1 [Araneus ventricosus]
MNSWFVWLVLMVFGGSWALFYSNKDLIPDDCNMVADVASSGSASYVLALIDCKTVCMCCADVPDDGSQVFGCSLFEFFIFSLGPIVRGEKLALHPGRQLFWGFFWGLGRFLQLRPEEVTIGRCFYHWLCGLPLVPRSIFMLLIFWIWALGPALVYLCFIPSCCIFGSGRWLVHCQNRERGSPVCLPSMANISCHCWEHPRGDPGPSAERRCRYTGWILSEWRGVTGTCFEPLLIEGATSATAGWVRIDPFEKSSRVKSVPRVSTVRRRPWTSAWGRHVGAFWPGEGPC